MADRERAISVGIGAEVGTLPCTALRVTSSQRRFVGQIVPGRGPSSDRSRLRRFDGRGGYLRRTLRAALTSLGFQARCRTRRGRVDFGVSPRWPLAASADRHRYSVRRLIPSCSSAASSGTCSSAAMLRYDRTRMDLMFMVRAPSQWVCVHWRLPDPAPRSRSAAAALHYLVTAAPVPDVSELEQPQCGARYSALLRRGEFRPLRAEGGRCRAAATEGQRKGEEPRMAESRLLNAWVMQGRASED